MTVKLYIKVKTLIKAFEENNADQLDGETVFQNGGEIDLALAELIQTVKEIENQ